MGIRKLFVLLYLYSWCLLMVVWLFLAVQQVFLQFVIVVFPDHTHLLFSIYLSISASIQKNSTKLLNQEVDSPTEVMYFQPRIILEGM